MIRIDVTQEHIDRGVPMDCKRCAVALAMMDADLESPTAACGLLTWEENGEERTMKTPMSVREFMDKYDARAWGAIASVEPFSFDLDDSPRVQLGEELP